MVEIPNKKCQRLHCIYGRRNWDELICARVNASPMAPIFKPIGSTFLLQLCYRYIIRVVERIEFSRELFRLLLLSQLLNAGNIRIQYHRSVVIQSTPYRQLYELSLSLLFFCLLLHQFRYRKLNLAKLCQSTVNCGSCGKCVASNKQQSLLHTLVSAVNDCHTCE